MSDSDYETPDFDDGARAHQVVNKVAADAGDAGVGALVLTGSGAALALGRHERLFGGDGGLCCGIRKAVRDEPIMAAITGAAVGMA